MARLSRRRFLLSLHVALLLLVPCSCQVGDSCSAARDCGVGLYCGDCAAAGRTRPSCIRDLAIQPTSIVKGLPFNRYSWLVTHNSFSIVGEPSRTGVERVTFYNQEDTVTNQLRNGVRGLMLDMYDFGGDVWLCHSLQGQCYNFTAFEPAIDTLKEVEAFLSENPTEIVTIFIEDYVHAPMRLSKLFTAADLMKYWYPISEMPTSGQEWPTVTDMVAKNHRLLVFTSDASKESSEGIAYQWSYLLENECKYGFLGFSKKQRFYRFLGSDSHTIICKSKPKIQISSWLSMSFEIAYPNLFGTKGFVVVVVVVSLS